MRLEKFIFDDNRRTSFMRHLSFWLIYSTYYIIQSYAPIGIKEIIDPMVLRMALYSAALFLPVCIFFVYIFLYLLWSTLILKKQYLAFVLAFIILFSAGFLINCYMSRILLKLTATESYPNLVFGISLNNTINAIVIAVFALAIKFSKQWYLQRKLNLELARKKKVRELQLLKTRIQPSFLFETLFAIKKNVADPAKASELIVKLSDLLSYILYECNTPKVLLTKELQSVRDLIFLSEAARQNKLDLKTQILQDIEYALIVPLVLIPFLQNCVLLINNSLDDVKHAEVFISVIHGRMQFHLKVDFCHYHQQPWEKIIGDTSTRLDEEFTNYSLKKNYADPALDIKLELMIA